MARLVGVGPHSLHGLRRLQLLSTPFPAALRVFPDLKQDNKRWFAEIAALEEFSNSTSNGRESLGFCKPVDANTAQGLKKQNDQGGNKVLAGKTSLVNQRCNPSGAAASLADKIDTEKLTESIIGKFRTSPPSMIDNKAFLNKRPTGPSSKFHFPQGRTNTSEDNKNTWKGVLADLCGRVGKNKGGNVAQTVSNPSRPSGQIESDPKDDFADLDLPQVDKPLSAASKKESTPNTRPFNKFQDLNRQVEKETKPASHEVPQSTQADMAEKILSQREDPMVRSVNPDPRFFTQEESGHRVCIMNLPLSTNLALVRDALSIYGEVTGSYKRPTPNGSCATFIEFKTSEAKEDALAARMVQLENKILPILRVERPLSTVVRICKVSSESTHQEVLSTCGKFGNIDIIKRRGNGIFDVYYKSRELPNMQKILDSLNEVTFQHNRWSAQPAPLVHPDLKENLLRRKDGQAWKLTQMNRLVKRIENGLDNVSVWFEDLKTLNSMEESSRQS